MSNKLLIFGGSGHAKDVHSTALSIGYNTFEFVTSDGTCALPDYDTKIESEFDATPYLDWDCIVAIGNNEHRRRIQEQYSALHFANVVSETAIISPGAQLGTGTFVGTFAYIGPDAKVGDGVIINTHSVVGHDVEIGNFSHICPRVCLAGHVSLAEGCFVGAGALFNNGSAAQPLTVPLDTHIGMGCIVTHSIKHAKTRLIPKPNSIAVQDDQ